MLSIAETAVLVKVTTNRIRQIIKEHNLDVVKMTTTKVPPETVRKIIDLKDLEFTTPKKVVIGTEKGGVGKTFLTTSVATICAARGLKVLVIDVDPEACASNTLLPDDVSHQDALTIYEVIKHDLHLSKAILPTKVPNLSIVPCKGLARRAEKNCADKNPKKLAERIVGPIENDFDLIFFDLPPFFSNLICSFYLTSNLIIQPCEPSIYGEESVWLTLADIQEACTEFDSVLPNNAILLNFFRDTERASRDTRQSLSVNYPEILLPFEIRKSQDVINLVNSGIAITNTSLSIKEDLNRLADYIAPLHTKTPNKEGLQ